jgi:LysM repeat protein
MTSTRYLALAAIAFALPSCTLFKKNEPDYDTPDATADTANEYGVPDGGSSESVPYQPVNPPANNPTYSPAAYEENTAPATPAAPSHAAPAPSHAAASTSHVVAKGDTLGGIAKRYGVSSAAIKQANGMSSDTVVLGKTLVIPGASGPATRPAAGNASGGGKVHTVVKGDSLSKIATQHGVTVEALKKANNMTSDTVVLGSKLRIP